MNEVEHSRLLDDLSVVYDMLLLLGVLLAGLSSQLRPALCTNQRYIFIAAALICAAATEPCPVYIQRSGRAEEAPCTRTKHCAENSHCASSFTPIVFR